MIRKTAAALFITALVSTGCDSNPAGTSNSMPVTSHEVAEKARDALRVTGQFAAQSMEEFAAEAKKRMAEMDRQMHEWQQNSQPMTAEARARWNQQLEVVREQRGKLNEQLEQLHQGGSRAWERMKEGSEAAWHKLSDAFSQAADQFHQHHSSPDK